MHQLDPGLAGVMAHKFSSPGAGICQNSAVHCGLMFFIHLPSPSSHCSVPISFCVHVCMHVCACVCVNASMGLCVLSLPLSVTAAATLHAASHTKNHFHFN